MLTLNFLVLGVFASVCQGAGDETVPQPDLMKDSPSEQSAWLDQTIPKMMDAMRASKEVRAKVAGPLAVETAPAFPLAPAAAGLAPGDLGRWSALADAAVAANPRYGHGEKPKPRPSVTVMPHTGIVRVETTYPAPPATKVLEPSPLTINAWVCPDRQTALALFWLRNAFVHIKTRSPEAVRQSIIETVSIFPSFEARENPPGELAFWRYPRMVIQIVLTKGQKPMPADRLCFLRGNVVVEVSTVEFFWQKEQKKWLAYNLTDCAPDVISIMRSIDAGLVRFAKPEEPKAK